MMEWGFACDESMFREGEGGESVLPVYLESLVAAGFRWWEVFLHSGFSLGVIEKIREWSKAYDLCLSLHARFIGINFAVAHPLLCEAVVGVAEEDLRFAQAIGAQRIIFHAGSMNWYDIIPSLTHPHHHFFQTRFDSLRLQFAQATLQNLKRVVTRVLQYGIQPFVENLYCPWEFPRTPEEMEIFLSVLGKETGLALDIGHALITGHTVEEYLSRLGEHPLHVHFHWNDGQFDLHRMPPVSEETKKIIEQLVLRERAVAILEVSPVENYQALLEFLPQIRERIDKKISSSDGLINLVL